MDATTVTAKPQKTLKQYFKDHPNVGSFQSRPRYFEQGDYLTVFFRDEPCYAERIDELLTIYTATGNGEMVGFKIKGVTELLQHVVSLIGVERDPVAVNLLLLSAVGKSPVRRAYYKLGEKTKGFMMDRSELPELAMA